MNPVLMVWDLEDVAGKPFAHFSNEILMVLNSEEVVLRPFTHFSAYIFIFLSKTGGEGSRALAPLCQPQTPVRGPSGGPIGNLCSFEASI